MSAKVTDLNAYRIRKLADVLPELTNRHLCQKCQGHGFLRRVPDPVDLHRETLVPVGMYEALKTDFVCLDCAAVGYIYHELKDRQGGEVA